MTFGEFLGVAFWDSVFIGAAAIVMRIRHWRRHHHVPHRKLRAGHIACRARMEGAAVRTSSVQPPPAPDTVGSIPGAGTNSGSPTVGRDQARTRAWAVDGRRLESRATADTQGAHGVSDPGSATQTAVGPRAPHQRDQHGRPARHVLADEAQSRRPREDGGLGPKRPVTVTTPDVAVAGLPPHPRDEEVVDAVRPRLAASTTQHRSAA